MKKRLNEYFDTDLKRYRWPDAIRMEFKEEQNRWECYAFEAGSEREAHFLKVCEDLSIGLKKRSALVVTGNAVYSVPYLFLCIKEDKYPGGFGNYRDSINYYSQFIDFENVCSLDLAEDGLRTGETNICMVGARQKGKAIVDVTNTHANIDLMTLYHPHHRILIVSRHAKEIFEKAGLTGMKFVHCLERGRSYTEEEKSLDNTSETLEKNAKFFQLMVTEEVNAPPYAGNIIHGPPPCERCGSYEVYTSDDEYGFHYKSLADLKEVDFQYCKQAESQNRGIINLAHPQYVVSSKVVKIITDNKLKGWIGCGMLPKRKYDVIEIQGVTF